MKPCPCGSEAPYQACCAPFINGSQWAATPEQLMRSRYTAYTEANVNYIADTMRSPASDNYDKNDARSWAKRVKWIGLEVIQHYQEGETGFVEFIATFKDSGKLQRIHELSTFKFIAGRWYYTDGVFKS